MKTTYIDDNFVKVTKPLFVPAHFDSHVSAGTQVGIVNERGQWRVVKNGGAWVQIATVVYDSNCGDVRPVLLRDPEIYERRDRSE